MRTTYTSDKILNNGYRNTAWTPPTTVYAGLLTAVSNAEAGTVTETTYGSYARQSITFGAPAASSGGERIQNTNVITFPAKSDAGTVTIIAVGVYDQLTSGNLLDVIFLDDSASLPMICVADEIASNLLRSAAHGLTADHQVRFESTPAGVTLPGGLAENTTYFVISTGLTADDFSVSTTQGGGAVDISAVGKAIVYHLDPKVVSQNDQPTFAASTLSIYDD